MTASSMIEDARIRPDLFHWNGRMDPASFQAWLARNRWLGQCPADLLAFWKDTGGGDVFESETILGPLGDPQLGDDIVAVNREMHSRGMPETFVVFHIGMLVSAVDTASGVYVELAPADFHVLRQFVSLEEWYRATLRAEYRQRYNLP